MSNTDQILKECRDKADKEVRDLIKAYLSGHDPRTVESLDLYHHQKVTALTRTLSGIINDGMNKIGPPVPGEVLDNLSLIHHEYIQRFNDLTNTLRRMIQSGEDLSSSE